MNLSTQQSWILEVFVVLMRKQTVKRALAAFLGDTKGYCSEMAGLIGFIFPMEIAQGKVNK